MLHVAAFTTTDTSPVHGEYQYLLQKFPAVFSDKIGKIKDYQLELNIDSTVQPVVQNSRPTPLHYPCQGGSQAETAWRSRYHRTGHGPDIMGITTCHCRQAERWHTTVCKHVQAQRSSLPYTAPIPNNRRNPPRPKRLQLYFPKLILRNAITKLNLPNRLVNWQHSEHTLASAVTSVCHIEHQYALKYANT